MPGEVKPRHYDVVRRLESETDLNAWLEGKPREVAIVIALRTALRVLPYAMVRQPSPRMQKRMIAVLRACCISWAASSNVADHKFCAAANAAAAAARAYPAALYTFAALGAFAADVATDVAAYAAETIDPAYGSIHFAATAANRAAYAAETAKEVIWNSITQDANWYNGNANGSAANLASQPLWLEEAPAWFAKADEEAQQVWRADLAVWSVWAEWYAARVKGREQNWPLPDAHDRAINEWLIAQTNEWWERDDVRAINTDIAEKLAELSQVYAEAVLRGVLAELAAGKQPDLSSPMAQAALADALAAVRRLCGEMNEPRATNTVGSEASELLNPRAVIGGNSPPVDVDDPNLAPLQTAIANDEVDVAQAEVEARRSALETALAKGDVLTIAKLASWFAQLHAWLPEGFKKKFSETLGEKTANALVYGGGVMGLWMLGILPSLADLVDAILKVLEHVRWH